MSRPVWLVRKRWSKRLNVSGAKPSLETNQGFHLMNLRFHQPVGKDNAVAGAGLLTADAVEVV